MKTKTAKHTPGPWTATPGGIPELNQAMTREEHEANKRLIAAAPELLEVARLFLKVSCLCNEAGMKRCGHACPKSDARAAIAKAEGR